MKASKKTVPSRKSPSATRTTTSFTLLHPEMDVVYHLWDDLDRFQVSETDKALHYLSLRLKKLLQAGNVKWLASVRVLHGAKAKTDPLLGWRLRANYDLVPNPEDYQKLVAPMYHRNNRLDPGYLIGLSTLALVAETGNFRVHRLRDGWIPYRKFCRSEHYRLHYTELGITDRMWISFPLNADTESIFLVDRFKSSQHFSKRDALLVGTILRGIRGFHRRLFLSRGLLIGEKPLSPMFQQIVQKLLSGLPEKEIALSMNQSLSTTHKYIGTIYDRFGVKSRTALMSLWLGS